MSWAEVIHLRITDRESDRIVLTVHQLAQEIAKKGYCREIKLLRSALVDTDLSILLYHDTLKIEKNGSSLGLCIAAALKEYGMVNHMTWHEIRSFREPVENDRNEEPEQNLQ